MCGFTLMSTANGPFRNTLFRYHSVFVAFASYSQWGKRLIGYVCTRDGEFVWTNLGKIFYFVESSVTSSGYKR